MRPLAPAPLLGSLAQLAAGLAPGLVAFVLVALAGSLAVASPARAEDRALLVGLDRYGDPAIPETPGGAEDARSVARTLERHLGFAPSQIRVLTDEAATSEAIVREFQSWLVDDTEPGDRVFFLYAGHGSQLSDQDGDEDDGFDETLAPYDVESATGARQIRDDVIDSLIAQLSGRRAVLVFDSCHSGTLTRSLAPGPAVEQGVRFLPRPDQLARLQRNQRNVGGGSGYRLEASAEGDQKAFDRPRDMARMGGIVAISAAHPGQLAYPISVDGSSRGALSYLFELAVRPTASRGLFENLGKEAIGSAESVLTGAAGDVVGQGLGGDLLGATAEELGEEVTIGALETLIQSGMSGLQESGRLEGSQQPWFEVLSEAPIEKEPLFGAWQKAAATAVVHPVDDRVVNLYTVSGRSLFYRGENIVFEVSSDRPGHLYLLVFSEGETATCIFPNAADPDSRLGSRPLQVPTHGGYVLPVQEPFGRDLVVALVADRPLPLCERVDYTWSEVFSRVRLDDIHRHLRDTARRRGIGVSSSDSGAPAGPQGSSTSGGDLPAWQSATLTLQTVDAPAAGGRP